MYEIIYIYIYIRTVPGEDEEHSIGKMKKKAKFPSPLNFTFIGKMKKKLNCQLQFTFHAVVLPLWAKPRHLPYTYDIYICNYMHIHIYIYIYPYVNGYNHYYNQQSTINDQSLTCHHQKPQIGMADDSLKKIT